MLLHFFISQFLCMFTFYFCIYFKAGILSSNTGNIVGLGLSNELLPPIPRFSFIYLFIYIYVTWRNLKLKWSLSPGRLILDLIEMYSTSNPISLLAEFVFFLFGCLLEFSVCCSVRTTTILSSAKMKNSHLLFQAFVEYSIKVNALYMRGEECIRCEKFLHE